MKNVLQLYGLKNCDTCKKAMKALDAAGTDFEFHDIRDGSLEESQVSSWLTEVGSEALLNKRSTTWRNLTDAERAGADSEKQLIKVLIANPTLIKRPVIVLNGVVSVGWTPKVQSEVGV